MFVTTIDGTVDLDNKATYPMEWLHMSTHTLWRKSRLRAGNSLFYLQFLRSNLQSLPLMRVWKLCNDLAKLWADKVIEDTPANRLKLMKWIYRFEDEVENQV